MKVIHGIKLGGLQQKIFNLVLIFMVLVMFAYTASSIWTQRNLAKVVQEASVEQQASITDVSEQTMAGVLENTTTRITAFQAYIADDLFNDVRTNVQILRVFADELFRNADVFADHPVYPPNAANDGVPSAMLIHEPDVDPSQSRLLGLVGNMSEIMISVFKNSENMSGCFVGTADGNLLFVNDRAATYINEDGSVLPLDVRHRPWYVQAVEAGELIFTGVEPDAYTDIPMIECAAPIYNNGELAGVVGADISLTSIRDYVAASTANGSFLCVVNEKGHVLFSPAEEGTFKVQTADNAVDLRAGDNTELAQFIEKAFTENTGINEMTVDGKEYYIAGAPLSSVGWTVLNVIDKEITRQPTEMMLKQYDAINEQALNSYREGMGKSRQTLIVLTAVIFLLATVGSLFVAGRIVKPIERMTKRINTLRDGDTAFEMEDAYRTNDEIEILAESFAVLSKKTKDYITQITQITAEKERIGTELALATRIQADMLPNIYPAFPERPEFDIYASMTPAKEVGGDFYDFFLIDDTHLGLVIADVSGKGVPAALFMMISKILVQNYAMTGRSPAEVLRAVNNQICSNNREEMFVTVWFGILDTATGKITAANAGHEYPTIMQAGGKFELLKDKHGIVIGGMEGVKYREYELTLTPGSKLFVYTDGVPEATDAQNQMFGTDRMLDALNSDPNATPEGILKNVRSAVDGFVKEAEQFDDLTMLCLEYRGNDNEG